MGRVDDTSRRADPVSLGARLEKTAISGESCWVKTSRKISDSNVY